MKNLLLLMVAFLLFCSTSPPDFHVRANDNGGWMYDVVLRVGASGIILIGQCFCIDRKEKIMK